MCVCGDNVRSQEKVFKLLLRLSIHVNTIYVSYDNDTCTSRVSLSTLLISLPLLKDVCKGLQTQHYVLPLTLSLALCRSSVEEGKDRVLTGVKSKIKSPFLFGSPCYGLSHLQNGTPTCCSVLHSARDADSSDLGEVLDHLQLHSLTKAMGGERGR